MRTKHVALLLTYKTNGVNGFKVLEPLPCPNIPRDDHRLTSNLSLAFELSNLPGKKHNQNFSGKDRPERWKDVSNY
jgi:hypothetical protein